MKAFSGTSIVAAVALTWLASVQAAAPSGRYTFTAAATYDTSTRLTWQRTASTTTYTWLDARAYCASDAVSAILGGVGHLPSINELQTIVDYSQSNPAIDRTAFPGTPSSSYWSSSGWPGSSPVALAVDFALGNSSAMPKLGAMLVRCVHY
jgi:Protein of unknown function (DUF1566)